MIAVIIPTLNRQQLLSNLVRDISMQLGIDNQIIIVDASDSDSAQSTFSTKIPVLYIRSPIKSAAFQRNLGLDNVDSGIQYVFFLDDDVSLCKNYFKILIGELRDEKIAGVSGVAVNPYKTRRRMRPSGVAGLAHRIFLLDSINDGKLLISGVNIPIRNKNEITEEVEWLIGCSAWRAEKILETRFEEDFVGQSLAEDVIFSVRMRHKGKLLVNTKVQLIHYESPIERPNETEFWRMWVKNRRRLIKVMNNGWLGLLAYWWANMGQIFIEIYAVIKGNSTKTKALRGHLLGILDVLKGYV